jgi:hypothetical protein
MNLGTYSFLPWLRRGIANQLQTPAAGVSRASVPVTVRVKTDTGGGQDAPPRQVLLVGPGDITGIAPQMVIRTEPRPGIASFEPNYLPYVDFYDEDFVWRYTPEAPDGAKHRLTPWLTLLVLKQDEFKLRKRAPLPQLDVATTVDFKTVLPPDGELWAWAHVHVNGALPDNQAPNLDILSTLLRQSPDAAYCRLLSPRRLLPNTAYHAFVIPTFEGGRQAGLGLTPPDDGTALKLSWLGARKFPVYFDWAFATGVAGDFEDLVTALQPREIPKEVGIRALDVQQPGFHTPPTTGQPNDIVGLEGVLLSPTAVRVPVDPACTLPANLAAEVNRADDEQHTGLADPDDDPLVTVPLYGRWHAFVERVAPFATDRTWINELNTDPRFRAVAGMGTQVIQQNQEDYMRRAWEQIGDVLGLNRKIAFLQVSIKASTALYGRQLTTLPPARALAVTAPVMTKVLGSPVTVDTLVARSRLPRAALSGAMRKQLRPRGQLARRTFGPPGTVDPVAQTIVGLNDGTITAAPPKPPAAGVTYEGALAGVAPTYPAWLRWLARNRVFALIALVVLLLFALLLAGSVAMLVIVVAIAAAAAIAMSRLAQIAKTLDTVDAFAPSALTPDAIAALPPNDTFVMPADDLPPGTPEPPLPPPPTGGADSVDGAAFRIAAIELHARISDRPAPLAVREPLALANVHRTLMTALQPAPAFLARHGALLTVGARPLARYIGVYHDAPPAIPPAPSEPPPDPRIVPVMAYPDIAVPMYRPLKDLQKDNFVPNLHLIQPDTISLMVTNPPVIEAYMVGLNHEFARELLWREYPTDQRPSTFRQFWEPSKVVPSATPLSAEDLAEKVRDIKRIHEWLPESTLGTHNNRLPNDDRPRVVLVIRGELLKRYPDTIIYAQKARWGDPPHHQNHLSLFDEHGEHADPKVPNPNYAWPIFRASVEPDLEFVGFDLLLDDVRGDPTLEEDEPSRLRIDPKKLGWFFVLQEVVGEPRFGLDEHKPSTPREGIVWNNLSWEHLPAGAPVVPMTPAPTPPGTGGDGGAAWGTNAANMAFILYQQPVLVAVHARRMLAKITVPTP